MNKKQNKSNTVIDALNAAGLYGAKMAVGQASAEELASLIEKGMGQSFPTVLNVPPFNKAKPLLVATAVWAACSAWEEKIPYSMQLKDYALAAMSASFYEFFKPYLKDFMVSLKSVAASLNLNSSEK